MVQHGAGAAGGPQCYNTIPFTVVVPQRLRLAPTFGIISSLHEWITCLFGCGTNHKLGTEAPVHLSRNKFAAEVTLYWWVSTVLKN